MNATYTYYLLRFYAFLRTRPATIAAVLIVAILILPGCGSTEYVRVPVEVEVPIAVPCSPEVDPPGEYATQKLTPASSDGEVIRAMLIEIEERGIVENYLRALLAGCG